MRTWRNWQTRYFEVVVPYGVQVQVLPCAPNTGSGNSSGNPQKEPNLRAKLTIWHPRSFHVSGQVQTVFDAPFVAAAWQQASAMNSPRIREVMNHGKPQWLVDIPASMTAKRKRLFFATQDEAEKYVRKAYANSKDVGFRSAFIPPDRMEKLLRLGRWLEENGIDPANVPAALAKRPSGRLSVTAGKAAEQFVQAKASKGCRQRYLAKLERTMRLLLPNRRDLPIAELGTDVVEEFLGRNGYRPATRKSYRSDLGSFFSWCVRKGYRDDNPVHSTEAPILDDKAPGILTASEVRDLLDATQRHSPRLVPWVRHYRERVNPREAQAAGNDPESPSTPVLDPSPALLPSLPILEAWVKRQP